MADYSEMRAWCQQNHLSDDTYQALLQEGFTSLKLLGLLTPEEVDKWLKQPRLLPLAQSLALQHAVGLLRSQRNSAEEAMEVVSYCATSIPQDFNYDRGPLGTARAQQLQQQQRQHQQPIENQCSSKNTSLRDAASISALAEDGPFSFEDFEKILPEEHYRFLLVGKTGSGKSTTGNSILGANLFDEDVAFDSLTNRNQLKRGIVDGKIIEIMDCPGLFDTRRTHEEVSVDIVKAVACMHPGPHAILYIIRLGRYTDEEYEVYARLKALFDADVTRYVIVVFTGGDMLEREGKSIEEVLQKVPNSLHKVLDECQHRVAVFNNVAPDKQRYVTTLIGLVQQMLLANGGGFYTCPRYAAVGQGLEEEVEQRLLAMEKENLANKPYIQELKSKALSAEEGLQRTRRLFEQREQERQIQAQQAAWHAEEEMNALVEEMKYKDLTLEQQQAEKKRLMDKHEQQKEELRREAERQRQQDKKELEEKEREFHADTRKAEEEQKRFLEAKRRVYELKVAQMKDQIAQDKEPAFLDRFLNKIKAMLGTLTAMLPTLPFIGGDRRV